MINLCLTQDQLPNAAWETSLPPVTQQIPLVDNKKIDICVVRWYFLEAALFLVLQCHIFHKCSQWYAVKATFQVEEVFVYLTK